VCRSHASEEKDRIWGERKGFHGDEKPWEERVDYLMLECVPSRSILRSMKRN
jgi:hypothetical protein